MLLRLAFIAGVLFLAFKIYRIYREISTAKQKTATKTAKDITSQAKVLDEKRSRSHKK